jgi:hypothetical protein
MRAQDAVTRAATIVLVVLCSAAPAFFLDWLACQILPGLESWRQWRRTATPLRALHREHETQLRQRETEAQLAEQRVRDREYLAGLYDRTYERERRRQRRNVGV